MSSVASTRWCPTPEQLMILEELYRNGVRTPNAPQIRRITAHLSMFGKIEGKNVFYWFQNHKARDRQKLRKKISKQLQQQQQHEQQQVQYFPYDNHHYLQCHGTGPDRVENHRLLLNYFDPLCNVHLPHGSCASPGFVHLSAPHSSPTFPSHTRQVGLEGAPRIMEDTNMMIISSSTCGHDRMMMTMAMEDDDVGPPLFPQYSTNSIPIRPLKTLELFPIRATNLKEECNSKPY